MHTQGNWQSDAQDTIVIRLTGDSGDGVQLLGEQLTITAALSGRDVRTLPDYPAEIRAPAGTIAGVSGFQLAMAPHAIFTAGETLDVLVALNPAALKHSLEYLKPSGLLIINEDSFTEKDWLRAGLSSTLLTEAAEQAQIIALPLITQTLEAVKETDISHAQAKKSKNFYVLGIVFWLFDLSTDHCVEYIQKKFKNSPLLVQANVSALLAGYNYAMTLELARQIFSVDPIARPSGNYRQITGIEAVGLAMATLAVRSQSHVLVAGYPITPASGILQECARLSDYGVHVFQSEDEIAAIGACLGAAFGGNLAVTFTSGPGFDLKSESLGLAVVAELPIVVVDVQRAGASTGLPTKTGQSDLRQALYGRHGEAPLPVIAAQTPGDCFATILEAFGIAVQFMTPVVVLLDAYLANAAEPWKIPDPATVTVPSIQYNRFTYPYQRDERLARSWNKPGTHGFIHQIGGLEKQGEMGRVSYDAENHAAMVELRQQKVAGIAREYPSLTIEGDPNTSVLVIGWGSTYGAMKSAIEQLNTAGSPVAMIHLRYLNPLPADLGQHLARFNTVLVAELNTGQLCQLLRATYLVDAKPITQCNGQSFSVSQLIRAITQEVQHEPAL